MSPQETDIQTEPTTIPGFTTREVERMELAQRFLLNIAATDIAPLAARVGYDAEEHRNGWRLWSAAVGVEVPFDHYLTAADRSLSAAPSSLLNERIRFLDQAENRWFPRTRNAIRRFVAPTERERVEIAFFTDMSQQPEGPLVIASMEKFMVRLEGLKQSNVPGGKDAYAALERRGLSASLVEEIKDTIARCKTALENLPRTAAPTPNTDIVRSRREAYEKLNLWYTDWADTFRSELGYHQLVRLGLTTRKGGRPTRADQPTETDEQTEG